MNCYCMGERFVCIYQVVALGVWSSKAWTSDCAFISPNATGHFVCDQFPSSINRPADTSYPHIPDEVRMNHSMHVDLSLEEIKTTENFMQVGGRMKVQLVMGDQRWILYIMQIPPKSLNGGMLNRMTWMDMSLHRHCGLRIVPFEFWGYFLMLRRSGIARIWKETFGMAPKGHSLGSRLGGVHFGPNFCFGTLGPIIWGPMFVASKSRLEATRTHVYCINCTWVFNRDPGSFRTGHLRGVTNCDWWKVGYLASHQLDCVLRDFSSTHKITRKPIVLIGFVSLVHDFLFPGFFLQGSSSHSCCLNLTIPEATQFYD